MRASDSPAISSFGEFDSVKWTPLDVSLLGVPPLKTPLVIEAKEKGQSVFIIRGSIVNGDNNIIQDVGIDNQMYFYTNVFVVTPDRCVHRVLTVDDVKPSALK